MFAKLRSQFGGTGLILSVIAIVLALAGGAIAANHAATASKSKSLTKAQVVALIKQYAKEGPAGANGTNGTNGAPGAKGENGANGNAGAAGESVTVTSTHGGECVKLENASGNAEVCEGAPGNPGKNGSTVLSGTAAPSNAEGVEGDFYIDTATDEIFGPKGASTWSATGTSLKGSPWTDGGTLPPLATETGVWNGPVPSEYEGMEERFGIPIPLSFPIPLAESPTETHVLRIGEAAEQCPGVAEAPAATPGNLCVYEGNREEEVPAGLKLVPHVQSPVSDEANPGTVGALAEFKYQGEALTGIVGSYQVTGTFAVTAPCPTGEEAVEEPASSGEFVCKPEA